jgi:mannosyltransferase PIG-V
LLTSVRSVEGLQKLARFLGRHFGPPRLALGVACWILALGVWGTLARHVLPLEHKIRWEIPLELRAPLYAKFDSGWYLSIMEWGYGPPPPAGKPSTHAFFPLYPFTAKVLHKTFAMDGFHAGLVVSYVCLFLAASLLWREARERLGEEEAPYAVAFLLLSPVAFFLQAVYAESMFLLFALLAFRDTRAGRWKAAALWALLLGLTRASALAVAPALFLAALEGRRQEGPRRFARAAAIGAIPAAVPLAWIFGMGWFHGEPGLFFRAMEGWHRGTSSFAGVGEWFWQLKLSIKFGSWMNDPTKVLDYGLAGLAAVMAVWLATRRRWSDAAWMGCALGLPITTGITGGIPRFLLVVYPTYIALAEGSRSSPRARRVFLAASGAVLLWTSARFVNWLWVA